MDQLQKFVLDLYEKNTSNSNAEGLRLARQHLRNLSGKPYSAKYQTMHGIYVTLISEDRYFPDTEFTMYIYDAHGYSLDVCTKNPEGVTPILNCVSTYHSWEKNV